VHITLGDLGREFDLPRERIAERADADRRGRIERRCNHRAKRRADASDPDHTRGSNELQSARSVCISFGIDRIISEAFRHREIHLLWKIPRRHGRRFAHVAEARVVRTNDASGETTKEEVQLVGGRVRVRETLHQPSGFHERRDEARMTFETQRHSPDDFELAADLIDPFARIACLTMIAVNEHQPFARCRYAMQPNV